MRIRVLLVDDHQIMVEGLASLLANEPDIQVVGRISNGSEVLRMIPRMRPDVLVLDKEMPDLDGYIVAEMVHQQHPKTHIVILTQHSEVGYAADALRKGAQAFVSKDAGSQPLLEAIHQVMDGQIYLSPPLTLEAVNNFRRKTRTGQLEPADTLTPSERIIFNMLIKGLSSREIGLKLGNSKRTVEAHRAKILHKLMVSNTYELIRYANEHGLAKPDEEQKDE
jgi:two-component system, NarL family, response regulator NreC